MLGACAAEPPSRSAARADPALAVRRAPTGHLLVHPRINGKDAGAFIFDTGAGMCVVSAPHSAELGLRASGSLEALGIGGVSTSRT